MIRLTTCRNPLDADEVQTEHLPSDDLPCLSSILPPWATDPEADVLVRVNGSLCPRDEWGATVLVADDWVEVIERPTFGFGGLVLGLKFGAALFAKKVIIASLLKLVALFAINFIVSAILAPKKPRVRRDSNDSATYGIGGIASETNGEGAPIPVIYGEMRTGGVVVNRSTRASGGGTEVYTLLLLSEGPIEAVGDKTEDGDGFSSQSGDLPFGLEIDGQPAGEFPQVEAWVRLGDNDQAAIPGFANAERIDEGPGALLPTATVPNPPGAELTPQTGGFDPGDPTDAAELAKWDTELSFTLDDPADEFGIILEFQEGLWKLNGGSIGANTADFQIRYTEADEFGTPFGPWVVLPKEPTVSASTTSPYQVEFRYPFIDPATYTLGNLGGYATFNGLLGFAEIASPTGILDQPSATAAFTIGAWIRFDLTDTTFFPQSTTYDVTVTGSRVYLAEQVNGNTGWRLSFIYQSELRDNGTLIPGDDMVDGWTWRLEVGTGTNFVVYEWVEPYGQTFGVAGFAPGPLATTALADWLHVVFTFDAAALSGSNARCRFWLNGAEKPSVAKNCDAVLAVTEDIQIARTGTTVGFAGDMDQFKLWNRALLSGDVSAQYAGGSGVNGGGNEVDLALAIQFDSVGTTTQPDSSPNGNDCELNTSGVGIVTPGKIQTAGGGQLKRGRYRVQIIRLDQDDTTDEAKSRATFAFFRTVEYQEFTYPGRALLAVKVRYENRRPSLPTFTVPVRGVRCPVWDKVSPEAPNAPKVWTRNPAWVALDMLTNPVYGLGRRFALDSIRMERLQEIANYSDQAVYDGGRILGGGGDVTLDTNGFPEMLIVIDNVADGLPDQWKVGSRVAIAGATTVPTFNTPEFTGATITAVTYNALTQQVVMTADWPFPSFYPDDPGSPTPDATATVYRVEPRFEYDGTFDRPGQDAWDAVLQVLGVAYSAPIREGSRLTFFIDQPEEPIGMVTQANTIEDTLQITWVSQADRPNVAEADILDRAQNWRRKPVRREHPQTTEGEEGTFVERSYSLEGVTRRSHANRHLDRDLEALYLLRRRATWKQSLDAMPWRPGAVVRIANDIVGWAPSGRFRDGCTTTELVLDRELEVPAGDFALYWQRAVDGTVELIEDATPSGTYAAGATITLGSALGAVPQEGDKWAHVSTVPTRLFRVVSAELDTETFEREFEAIEYNPLVYDLKFDELAQLPTTLLVPGAVEAQLPVLAPQAPVSLQVRAVNYEAADGSRQVGLRVSWQLHPDEQRDVQGWEVWVQDTAALTAPPVQLASVGAAERSALIPADAFEDSATYRVRVRARGVDGSARQLAQQPYAAFVMPERAAARRSTGAAFPTEARGGDRHYDTASEEWFYWDATRDCWLGESIVTLFAGGRNWTAGVGVALGGAATSTTYGFTLPYATRIVGASITVASGTHTVAIRIYPGAGAQVAAISLVASAQASDDTLNGAVPADTPILAVLTGANLTPANQLVLLLRREGNV